MIPNLCVLIPSYNNCQALERVVRESIAHLPVIVINDGSTDATPATLAAVNSEFTSLTVISQPKNHGKGRALVTGFKRALSDGFEYAITIDSDAHNVAQCIADFRSAIKTYPTAILIGTRTIPASQANWLQRLDRSASDFWTWIETGYPTHNQDVGATH